MAHRLNRIVTRTGDDGTTGLGDGTRVPKDSRRIAAIGEVDELNATLGVLVATLTGTSPDGPPSGDPAPDPTDTRPALAALIRAIQHDLFSLGAELSIPGFEKLATERIAALDEAIARYNATLAPLAEFILPGGSASAAQAHVARTVCRRAERSVVALAADNPVRPACRHYLNRLSDLLFVLARTLNRQAGVADVAWQNPRA